MLRYTGNDHVGSCGRPIDAKALMGADYIPSGGAPVFVPLFIIEIVYILHLHGQIGEGLEQIQLVLQEIASAHQFPV